MDWDYTNHEVHVSMQGYVEKALRSVNHNRPTKSQHQLHSHVPPKYGAKVQHVELEDTSPPLDKSGKTLIQEVTGSFLFYAPAVDSTMLVTLSSLMAEQANPTKQTCKNA